MIEKLSAKDIRRVCRPEEIEKLLTGKPPKKELIVGQERAVKALRFGLDIDSKGYNIFVSGSSGTGKLTSVNRFLKDISQKKSPPDDWCYVNNFQDSYHPKKLRMPQGRGNDLKKDVKELVEQIKQNLKRVFESEEFEQRKKNVIESYNKKQTEIFEDINKHLQEENFMLKQTPWGFATLPIVDDSPMSDEQFQELSDEEQEKIKEKQKGFQDELTSAIRKMKKMEKEATDEVEKLKKEVALSAIRELMEDVKEKYRDVKEVGEFLDAIREDILENLEQFTNSKKAQLPAMFQQQNVPSGQDKLISKYEVNVIVDNAELEGAPVVTEFNPTYNNLFGKMEKESYLGALITDFSLIRKGAMHKANGGYLIIPIRELLKNPFSYDAVKRALRNEEIKIEEPMDQLGYMSTKTLKPEPLPLEMKILLIGEPIWYYLLYKLDPDFKELFKVRADFDTTMDRTDQNIEDYLSYIDTLCNKENLQKPDATAIAKFIEHGSRIAGDQKKLSARFGEMSDILREANYYAKTDGANGSISEEHIRKAIEEREYRSSLIRQKIRELIERDIITIDITGTRDGQVNGLSVLDLGDIQFGKPNKITSSISIGKEGVIAIERKAKLSGPIHTKGVLILAGYLSEKFGQDMPISLSAHIVFEQSYSEVEGDSASSTELYSLLSGLSGIPIKQGIAVTGSVNQKGFIQAIGGVNEKVEGFYEICKYKGLTGDQGVIIPESNRKHLMVKEEILNAVKEEKFHIWPVRTVNEGIEILTGVEAGEKDERGKYKEGTIFYKVNNRLNDFANKMKSFVISGEMESLRELEEAEQVDSHWQDSDENEQKD